MALSKLLRELIGKQKQGAVAEEWRQRWNAISGEDVKADTAETRLSGCVNDKVEGVRFFFEARARGALLLEVLGSSEAQREAIFREADEVLAASGSRPPRVVIDLGRWDANRDAVEALSIAVEEQILRAADLWPVAIVLTTAQYRWLPRTIDESDDRVRIDKQADAAACEARARALATPSTLVVAPWRHEPFHLWAAFSWSIGRAAFSPVDAVATFAREGRLAPLPTPAPTLTSLGVLADAEKVAVPSDGVKLRELMLSLTSAVGAEALKKPAATRLALARSLGVEAAATEREVLEHDLATLTTKLGMPVDTTGRERARDELLSRALRRAVEPRAFRIGDEIHIVAPAAAIDPSVREHPRAKIHLVELRVPAISRLCAALTELTADDLLEDPLLEKLIARLDPDGREAIPFAHARARLFRSRSVAPRRAPRADWRTALDAIVRRDPPAAMLYVEPEAWVMPDRLRSRATATDLCDLAFFPTHGPLLMPAQAHLLATENPTAWGLISPSPAVSGDYPEEGGRDARTPASDVEQWQDALDAWIHQRDTRHHSYWQAPKAAELEVPWAQELLDGMVTSAWFALRRAVRSSDVVLRPDGTAQVHVGGGICLVVDARAHVSRHDSHSTRAALSCVAGRTSQYDTKLVVRSITQHLTFTGSESEYEPGWTTPRGLYLAGGGYAVDVRFAFVPWLRGAGEALALHAPIRKRMDDDEAAAEAARQQQDAYDDD
jgi:hypothetical protein